MDLRRLGQRIKAQRIHLGLYQADVAKAIGTSRSNYAKYEAGEVDLNISTIEALARALEVPMSYFLPPGEDEWAPEGSEAAFFNGFAPEDRPAAKAIFDALRDKARRAESVIGRKAE